MTSTDHEQRVRVDVAADGVARVRFNRPERHNGLDVAQFDAIIAAGERLAADSAVRVVVLSGEGPSFCAGLDFKAFISSPDVGRHLLQRPDGAPANLAQQVGWTWRELPVPVIAAIHGACFGGGLQIALGADLRYAAPDAKLSVMEIQYGLIPDMSITQTLLPLVRPDIARELTFTGRVVSGAEAAALGLVTGVADDPVAAALDAARAIAARSPNAIRAAKRLFDSAPRMSPAESFALETELQLTLLGTPEQLAAATARMQARAARRDPTE